MGFVDIQCDADLGGFPLLSTVVGAATRWQALSDASDATYVKQETASAQGGIDIVRLADPTIPAGAVVTRGEIHGRSAHAVGNTSYSFSLTCDPKPAYKSAAAPNTYATMYTPLKDNGGSWNFLTPADGTPYSWGVVFESTWAYNNGHYAWDYLTWDKMDLTTLKLYYGWYTTQNAINRIHFVFIRIYYDAPPTISNVRPSDLSAGQTFTTSPTILWDYTDDTAMPQQKSRVIIVAQGTYDIFGKAAGATGFNPEWAVTKAYDGGEVSGSGASHTVGPFGLTNLGNYYAYVRSWHAPVAGNEMMSTWVSSAVFQVNGAVPNSPTLTVTPDDTNSRHNIEILQGNWSSTPYTNFFQLQRAINQTTDWEEVRDGVAIFDASGLRTGSTATNNISTPHAAALALTGALDIKLCMALEGAPTDNYLVCKGDTPNGTSWNLRLMSTNKPQFEYTNAGLRTALCPNALPLPTAKTPFWIRCVYNPTSNWSATFYYSLQSELTDINDVVWILLGTFTGSGSGTITSTNAPLSINGTPTINQSTFRIYFMELRNASSVIVANPDFRGLDLGATTFTDSLGAVWTIVRSGANMNLPFVTLYDYEVNQAEVVAYRAQAVTINAGIPVATAWVQDTGNTLATVNPQLWWFKVIFEPTLNRRFDVLPGSWDGHRPTDAAAYSPLGRFYKVVVSGGTKGNEQTMVVECLTAIEYDALLAIYNEQSAVLVQQLGQARYFSLIDWSDDRNTLANGYSQVTLTVVETGKPVIT